MTVKLNHNYTPKNKIDEVIEDIETFKSIYNSTDLINEYASYREYPYKGEIIQYKVEAYYGGLWFDCTLFDVMIYLNSSDTDSAIYKIEFTCNLYADIIKFSEKQYILKD